ncbi:MAG TPA: thioesterase family protein [Pseudomonas sp.]|uniref:acyl-CoA thioesterase n=1 Tax=Pseudomonas sp. TaxID=306 RepID=UPI002B48F877|nr:thioesterase family protein [Pseudomonas sp.]HKS15493.1 thioesterase family protein [Pseudomonas sp.]
MPALHISSAVVHQWHCDHFGHMNTRHYAGMFDDAVFLFWSRFGVQAPVPGEPLVIPVTAEMKTGFLAEAKAGTSLEIHASVRRVGGKSATLHLRMSNAANGEAVATCDIVEVFFDNQSRTSQAIPEAVRHRLLAAVEDNGAQ